MSSEPIDDRPEGWGERVAFAPGADGYAYRPGEVVVTGGAAVDAANRLFPATFEAEPEPVFPDEDFMPDDQRYVLRGQVEALDVVDELRSQGARAQPNHVFFSHSCCCGPHPSALWQGCLSGAPVYASPVYASPVYASPVFASPVYASPVFASPVYASLLQATGRRRSSVVACDPPAWAVERPNVEPLPIRVGVLDTGLAADGFRPAALDSMVSKAGHQSEVPDEDGDLWLDPAAGHGTFIAALIDLVLPGCQVSVERVLSNYGDGDEITIARGIIAMASSVSVLNLSFGGYASEQADVLGIAVRHAQAQGTVIVASAGNDGTCRPTFPAALRGVIGVGAFGPTGPAPFSNYGPWVRACAPGVDVVSRFFVGFDGNQPAGAGGGDPDKLHGWARWSGTSFAAPQVAAALAREMALHGCTGAQAIARTIDAPGLLRLPHLGTVVNIA